MTESTNIKKILIGESYLKYYHDDPDKFYQFATTINNMQYSQLRELDKKFQITKKYKVLSEGIISHFVSLSGILFQTPLWGSYRAIKGMTDKCIKRCGTFSFKTVKRKICIEQCKLLQYQKSLAIAQQARQYCNKTIDNLSCLRKTDIAIKGITNKIVQSKQKISKLEMKNF